MPNTSLKRQIKKALPDWLIVIRRYWQVRGAFPNFIRPKTFSEKTLHRLLFDRRPLLSQIADKAAVRAYVAEKLGPQFLPELYQMTRNPEQMDFDTLPGKFVVKPTHGSGWVYIVPDKSALDCAELIRTCSTWLQTSYYETTREWVYKNIEPCIMIEEFIDDGSGEAPKDYKFFVFGGKVEFIQVDAGRFTDHRRRLYTPAWKKLDVLLQYDDILDDLPPPPHLAELIAAAETLGKDFDFIRADFYDTPARIYFGELTTTPGCGLEHFRPAEYDRYLGELWKLPTRKQRA